MDLFVDLRRIQAPITHRARQRPCCGDDFRPRAIRQRNNKVQPRVVRGVTLRIGEVLLFPKNNLSLDAPVANRDPNMPTPPVFRGLHGGLTPDEALVPLLALRL